MKEKPKQRKGSAKKRAAKRVRKPDGHIIPKLKPDKAKEPVYTIRKTLGYVVQSKDKVNFCLVSVRGKADPVPCTIPSNKINALKLKGKVIEMEEFTKDGKQYYRHISLANTGAWHGINPTKE